jgi:deoxyribodipyrimidine photolyase-related protein
MTETLRFILGDQLSRSLSALEDADPDTDVILMAEVADEASYVRHHKQKLVLVFSAMRHFARGLEADGYTVYYIHLDDPDNRGSLGGELARALQRHGCKQVVMTEPGEWRVRSMMDEWKEGLAVPMEIRPDTRFLCSLDTFGAWAEGRKTLRMEFFYRDMRRKTGWLMEDDKPVGGQWNYDADNRKKLPRDIRLPERRRYQPDGRTREIMALVEQRFPGRFGELEGFGWPVTRDQALDALAHFVAHCLSDFGRYQDAMKAGESFLFHSLLSTSLNLGLLEPRETCEAALAAYQDGDVPLNAVEGFIRQILGWREFVRGLYWQLMPGYAHSNFFEADRALPDFYWTGNTDLACLHQAIDGTRRHAYAHHIQRLMVTGNFALLAGIDPAEVEEWYLLVYADAFEWVELPNTHGMALFADGGVLASKPYAASGAYINRMSDYCKGCRFDPKKRRGENACPFNFLYWDFLQRNDDKLRGNPRMALAYRNLDRLSDDDQRAVKEESARFLDALEPGTDANLGENAGNA